ncbi:MAG: hypothetical protein ACOYJ2_04450 [Rickettsiales bacterium]
MLNKTQLAWSIATVTFIAAAGLGGALYRTHETSQKQQELITYLRNEQTKIGALNKEDTDQHADEIARLEETLHTAQAAQRDLTEQLFRSEENVKSLQDALDAQTQNPSPALSISSPLRTFVEVRKRALAGKPFREQLRELEPVINVMDASIRERLFDHADGIKTHAELVNELRETYAITAAPEDNDVFPWLAQWSHVITIRKPSYSKLDDYVAQGDIDKAAKHIRYISGDAETDLSDWLNAYDARRDVIKALDALEQQLVGMHG